jgi:hypothetical protein
MVLHRGAGEAEAMPGLELLRDLGRLRARILDELRLVENQDVPWLGGEELFVTR